MTHGQYHRAHDLVGAIHSAQGFHPGFRAVHALGRIYRGVFTASADGAAYTRAVHFQPGASTPVTVRFSASASDPTAGFGPITGMATKFSLPDGTVTDLLGLSLPSFPLPSPDVLLGLLRTQTPDPATGQPDKAAAEAYFAEFPKVAASMAELAGSPAPKSLAETVFNAIHTFWFENAEGHRTAARYRWVPEAGVSSQSVADLKAQPTDYLFTDFEERLATGPVRYELRLILAGDGDVLDDPTTAFPEDRPQVLLGHLALQRLTSLEEIGDPIMLHDPTRTTDGIDISDDPVLNARRGVYEVSAVNRGAGWKNAAAEAARHSSAR
ncbi:catalase [Mycolicibacterium sp.]|uniref:catalase n=1 Tax=Mycolicibacterium sp. TaxID=2320850 RepID=UPI0028AE7F35|nr:catalase [Mycolicibacterium sp.]